MPKFGKHLEVRRHAEPIVQKLSYKARWSWRLLYDSGMEVWEDGTSGQLVINGNTITFTAGYDPHNWWLGDGVHPGTVQQGAWANFLYLQPFGLLPFSDAELAHNAGLP